MISVLYDRKWIWMDVLDVLVEQAAGEIVQFQAVLWIKHPEGGLKFQRGERGSICSFWEIGSKTVLGNGADGKGGSAVCYHPPGLPCSKIGGVGQWFGWAA